MILKELKENIDFLMDTGHTEDIVVITTADKSIGARASSGIQGIYSGMDWETGQIRISPKEKLVKYGSNKEDAMIPFAEVYTYPSGRKRNLLNCRRCEQPVRKDDNYCSNCGQKIKRIYK